MVANAIRLNRASGSSERSTFICRIAPSQEASRKSARSSGGNAAEISPEAWASAMQSANGARHSLKISTSRSRSISLCGAASRLKSPIRHLGLQALGNHVKVAAQALSGTQAQVTERLRDQGPNVLEVAIEHLTGERLLGAKMVCERAVWRVGFRRNVTHGRTHKTPLEHDLKASVEDAITEGCSCHGDIIRTCVLNGKRE